MCIRDRLHLLQAHWVYFNDIAIDWSRRELLTCGADENNDGHFCLWDIAESPEALVGGGTRTLEPVHTFTVDDGPVLTVHVDWKLRRAVSVSSGFFVWNLDSNEILNTINCDFTDLHVDWSTFSMLVLKVYGFDLVCLESGNVLREFLTEFSNVDAAFKASWQHHQFVSATSESIILWDVCTGDIITEYVYKPELLIDALAVDWFGSGSLHLPFSRSHVAFF